MRSIRIFVLFFACLGIIGGNSQSIQVCIVQDHDHSHEELHSLNQHDDTDVSSAHHVHGHKHDKNSPYHEHGHEHGPNEGKFINPDYMVNVIGPYILSEDSFWYHHFLSDFINPPFFRPPIS